MQNTNKKKQKKYLELKNNNNIFNITLFADIQIGHF